MRVPHCVVVEPQERDAYAAVLDPECCELLTLPFSNLGQGSIPARNWCWEHAKAAGHARHWIMDDNLRVFYRLNHNLKVVAGSGAIFVAMEQFADRYENLAIVGPHYEMFIYRQRACPPLLFNHRVYSCLLIDNSIPFRWRGRYNEDTDLCLRVLKAGYCTALFHAFLADKMATMTMKGGNTDELYADDGRLKMAQSLQQQHPDVTRVVRKWGRWQHQVDYRPFARNRLVKKPDAPKAAAPNEFGMHLVKVPAKRARLASTPKAANLS